MPMDTGQHLLEQGHLWRKLTLLPQWSSNVNSSSIRGGTPKSLAVLECVDWLDIALALLFSHSFFIIEPLSIKRVDSPARYNGNHSQLASMSGYVLIHTALQG